MRSGGTARRGLGLTLTIEPLFAEGVSKHEISRRLKIAMGSV